MSDATRPMLAKAYRDLATTPAERHAQEQIVAKASAALRALGPDRLKQRQAEGSLPRDPQALLVQIVREVQAADARHAERMAARDAEDRQIAELAAPGPDADATIAALNYAAQGGDRDAAKMLGRLTGALWRVRARDPEFVKGMVEQHGIAGAQQVMRANGGAEALPLAAETYLSAKGDDWARAAQDLGADDPSGLGASDIRVAKQLRDPVYQRNAAIALLKAGVSWEGQGPTPGHVAMRHMVTVAEHGGDKTRLGEERLSDAEVAARAAELARGALGTAADAERTLQGVREGALELGLLHKLHARDEAKRKEHPAERTKADAARVEGERTRREALSREFDRLDKPERLTNVDSGQIEDVKGAARIPVHNERTAALARGYANISGEDVVMDVTSSGARELVERGDREREEDERRASSPREAMSRKYDELSARSETRSPEPAPSSTSSSPSADRRSVLSAEYDRLSSESEGA